MTHRRHLPWRIFQSTTLPTHPSILYPILHSIHVLFLFFLILYLVFLSGPLPTTFSRITIPTYSDSANPLSYHPFPCSSISKSLDCFPAYFFLKKSISVFHLYPNKPGTFLLALTLLLAGNVEINPGPTSPTSLIISHLNIRSAASVTAHLDKPASLQETISDHKIDILSLSESWLSHDTPSSVLNSLDHSTKLLFSKFSSHFWS